MSVIFFSAEELANVASYLTAGRLRGAERQQVAEWLAAYSVGNAVAYSRQYREETEPVSAADILKLMHPIMFRPEQARGTLRLLRYNGVTNAGREIPLDGYHEALAGLLSFAFDKVAREMEEKRDAA